MLVAILIALPVNAAIHVSGHLVFDELFFDFGEVQEGDIVKHTFHFMNNGSGKVKILKTETSCGCTTATSALRDYLPGEAGEMEVVVDTKGKKGFIIKTVTLDTENNNDKQLQFSLAMQLKPAPHPVFDSARNINTEKACKSCHLDSAVGQSDIYLYHRICSQCHGKKGQGGIAHALNDPEWQKIDDDYIRTIIRKGIPELGMPSYVDGVDPALTSAQVESLVKYIRSLALH